jgi:hypothetical protein
MTQGVIAEWCVKEGDSIKANSVMMKVETDKATVDFEATDESVLGKILVTGGEVTVGKVIAVLVEDAAAAAAFKSLSVEAVLAELGGGAAAPAAAAKAPAAAAAAAPAPLSSRASFRASTPPLSTTLMARALL